MLAKALGPFCWEVTQEIQEGQGMEPRIKHCSPGGAAVQLREQVRSVPLQGQDVEQEADAGAGIL